VPIEKFAFIVPKQGQGKRVMKSKLLTALGATGPNRPYTDNPEHILERKLVLQSAFNPTPAPVGPVIPANGLLNGLVHYYQFEALNGSNGVNDVVGTAHTTGTNGGADMSVNAGGILNNCIACSAAGTVNMLETVGNSPGDTKALFAGDGSVTLALWIWLDLAGAQTAGFPMTMSVWDSAAGQQYYILFVNNGNSIPTWRMQNNLSASVDLTWGAAITRQAWHLAVMGYDGTAGKSFLSIDNGALIYSGAFTPRGNSNNGSFGFFNALTVNNEWGGRNDECGVWNPRALTQGNINSLWNGGAGLPLSSFTA